MAGVLPFFYDNKMKTFYYLLGRESHTHPDHAGLYSDFGGSKEHSESKLETASREGYEESMGVFGTLEQIKKKIKHMPECMRISTSEKKYVSYLLEIQYQPYISQLMNRNFVFIKTHAKNIINVNNSIYEKDHFILATLADIKGKHYEKLRPFYKDIINKINETNVYDFLYPHGTS